MVLDPIRLNEPAVPDAAPARSEGARSQSEKRPVSAPLVFQPPSVPPLDTTSDVSVKWDHSDGFIVTFTDKKSGDIVRQIPSEQVLSVARFIRELLEEMLESETTETPTQNEISSEAEG